MSYGRASSDEELNPQVIEALANKMGLDVSSDEAKILTTLFLNQLAALNSFDTVDLQDVAPATIFSANGGWDE